MRLPSSQEGDIKTDALLGAIGQAVAITVGARSTSITAAVFP
jgi:hypothetical protein